MKILPRDCFGPTRKCTHFCSKQIQFCLNIALTVLLALSCSLPVVAETLKSSNAVVLVSGHSNTTPVLVNHLVGEKRFQWLHHFQFDFIFKVYIADNGETRVSIDYSLPRPIYGDHPLER